MLCSTNPGFKFQNDDIPGENSFDTWRFPGNQRKKKKKARKSPAPHMVLQDLWKWSMSIEPEVSTEDSWV